MKEENRIADGDFFEYMKSLEEKALKEYYEEETEKKSKENNKE